MAVFTLQGYARLVRRQSKHGAVISLVIMAAMCVLANQVNCTIELMEMEEPLQGIASLEAFGGFGGAWVFGQVREAPPLRPDYPKLREILERELSPVFRGPPASMYSVPGRR